MSAHELEDPGSSIVRTGARTTLMVAAVVAEQLARARADQQRLARSRAAAEAQRLEAQLRGEAETARAQLATYVDKQWVDQATPEAIGEAWSVARQWQEVRPEEFSPYVDRLRDGVKERFGVDLADVATAQEATDRLDASPLVERDAEERTPEQVKSDDRNLVDEIVAADVALGTHRDLDRDSTEAARADDTLNELELPPAYSGVAQVVDYGSAEHRNALERRATSAGAEHSTAAGRARAAQAQARPAHEATASSDAGKTKAAKKGRGRGQSRGSEPGR